MRQAASGVAVLIRSAIELSSKDCCFNGLTSAAVWSEERLSRCPDYGANFSCRELAQGEDGEHLPRSIRQKLPQNSSFECSESEKTAIQSRAFERPPAELSYPELACGRFA